MAHTTTLRVRFGELDSYRHVNHAVYISWFEAARTEALEDSGLGLGGLQDDGVQLVVTSVDVKYRRAAVAGDECVVETEIGEIRRASTVWHQRVMRGEEVLVSGEIRIGVCDDTGRPMRPPEGLIEKLAAIGD
ncbi:MAG: thioesterase family protein [Actinomycetota bacterium]|nr:thioesterase family protein [Actinomycetota bacterium]